MTGGIVPFRWWVFDGPEPPSITVPPADDPAWEVRYDGAGERGKRTMRHLASVPAAAAVAAELVAAPAIADWCSRLGYAVLPDPTLHGGGLQVTDPGGVLGVHLDYDRHPLLPAWRKALTVLAYLHPHWESSWGGALVLCDCSGVVVERIEPKPGRVVAFECSDLAYHGVEPVTGPAERVSLAVSLLAGATAASNRRRALFLPDRS